ncbi:TetR/AcrR family transcriptional regulator C-terminal domain-containing protein [Streptomyces flavofungini]|uniref:TetR/AcrR family transcriptional regulator C-terminal domain-containing protein n=1 Tax=Streptomyces flavofungini TaxID=68200 RepID=UPI0025B267B7|nr:TetR/AcrR family transcriptional regulator C-terminal domain-containing protein [Streptomyces flavofungini]WJV50572.1 TetR/AcrR family transcriptional regulator C-terminal domain-containing protein [Streptomyces flavofungini]
MTKKQGTAARTESGYRAGLTPGAVARAALDVLAEKGADGLSVRATAERLGVRMNTVLWHAKTKTRLLELMADAIVAEIPLDGLPDEWRARVRELMRRYRRALLAHRDGARIVAGTYAAEPATLRFAETLSTALMAGHPTSEREAAWTVWSLLYFVLGLTQEEQSLPKTLDPRLERSLESGEYPSLHRLAAHFRDPSFDGRFEHGLDLLLGTGAA